MKQKQPTFITLMQCAACQRIYCDACRAAHKHRFEARYLGERTWCVWDTKREQYISDPARYAQIQYMASIWNDRQAWSDEVQRRVLASEVQA